MIYHLRSWRRQLILFIYDWFILWDQIISLHVDEACSSCYFTLILKLLQLDFHLLVFLDHLFYFLVCESNWLQPDVFLFQWIQLSRQFILFSFLLELKQIFQILDFTLQPMYHGFVFDAYLILFHLLHDLACSFCKFHCADWFIWAIFSRRNSCYQICFRISTNRILQKSCQFWFSERCI